MSSGLYRAPDNTLYHHPLPFPLPFPSPCPLPHSPTPFPPPPTLRLKKHNNPQALMQTPQPVGFPYHLTRQCGFCSSKFCPRF